MLVENDKGEVFRAGKVDVILLTIAEWLQLANLLVLGLLCVIKDNGWDDLFVLWIPWV